MTTRGFLSQTVIMMIHLQQTYIDFTTTSYSIGIQIESRKEKVCMTTAKMRMGTVVGLKMPYAGVLVKHVKMNIMGIQA